MHKELISFIRQNNLTPFGNGEVTSKPSGKSLFITKDAKAVHSRVLRNISSNFSIKSTDSLWDAFPLTDEEVEVARRQEFFKSIHQSRQANNDFLKSIVSPRPSWKPKYGIVVVTEDEKTYLTLSKAGVPVQLLLTENDLMSLENYDLIQVVDCDNFMTHLERLPQTVFLSASDDAYLERYLEILSGWSKNLDILTSNPSSERIAIIVSQLTPLLALLGDKSRQKLTLDNVQSKIDSINENISSRLSGMSLTGTSVFSMLAGGKMPKDVLDIIEAEIVASGIPSQIVRASIPVTIDEGEFERYARYADADEFTSVAQEIKKNSANLRKVPNLLSELCEELLLFDFASGVRKYLRDDDSLPQITMDRLRLDNSKNIFLDSPQAINFHLNPTSRCSILTGANSGGKTTLIEHIIQLSSLAQLGLPVRGRLEIPLFTEIYYFAKTKGSAQKGAFETLLTQMSQIKPGNKTIILADEIEAVTEPGVAGKIICATADYFINKGCFLVIATHLGQEIKDFLPAASRIDGIEAKGLDENNELIVDHNPVIGRLARSTPELIVERLAKTSSHEYFKVLYEKIVKK
jgi:DNA mismatch repair protein MutS2